ncbi:hypothetical protein PoB_005793700 [Plakobranchus ocellatus]|uniref:Uncharacterized protein n=1 Tax=Plakobranchus ocellatus TaxID=259542 RepID=A0AAV4CIX4_9GAST|nr:hypothetical protein PoB_005793700 [Plakobranchus ocellatus]
MLRPIILPTPFDKLRHTRVITSGLAVMCLKNDVGLSYSSSPGHSIHAELKVCKPNDITTLISTYSAPCQSCRKESCSESQVTSSPDIAPDVNGSPFGQKAIELCACFTLVCLELTPKKVRKKFIPLQWLVTPRSVEDFPLIFSNDFASAPVDCVSYMSPKTLGLFGVLYLPQLRQRLRSKSK